MKHKLDAAIVILSLSIAGCAPLGRPSALMFERSTVAVQFVAPAGGIQSIELRGGVADIDIVGTTDTLISAELSLRSSDTERLRGECVESARLDTSRAQGTFVIALRQETRKRCGETWRVRIPSRLAAAVHVTVGKISVRDVRGGLLARVKGTGDVSGTVDGDVDVEVDVGDIDLTSEQSQYGAVELRSAVGKVDLTLRGYRVEAARHSGSGQRATAAGSGKASFTAKSRVGNVKARVGAR